MTSCTRFLPVDTAEIGGAVIAGGNLVSYTRIGKNSAQSIFSFQWGIGVSAFVGILGFSYVTETGSKYHSAGCRHLKKSCISISLQDAIDQGYTACSVCNPPALTTETKKTDTKKDSSKTKKTSTKSSKSSKTSASSKK